MTELKDLGRKSPVPKESCQGELVRLPEREFVSVGKESSFLIANLTSKLEVAYAAIDSLSEQQVQIREIIADGQLTISEKLNQIEDLVLLRL